MHQNIGFSLIRLHIRHYTYKVNIGSVIGILFSKNQNSHISIPMLL